MTPLVRARLGIITAIVGSVALGACSSSTTVRGGTNGNGTVFALTP
jgi:hypothetical protein